MRGLGAYDISFSGLGGGAMIEIQCTSCNTRYRIDERVIPDDTPTFKCSRCGHVFNADPLPAKKRIPAAPAAETDSQPAQMLRPARLRASAPRPPVERRNVMREATPPARAAEQELEPPPEHGGDRQPFESGRQDIDH